MLSDAGTSSTFNTSTAVADGHSDQLHRHLTYAVSQFSSAAAAADDDDSLVDVAREEEVEAARMQVEAFERREAAEATAFVAEQREREIKAETLDDLLCSDGEEVETGSDSDVTETGDDFELVGNLVV